MRPGLVLSARRPGDGGKGLLHLVGKGGYLPLSSENCQVSKSADQERREAPYPDCRAWGLSQDSWGRGLAGGCAGGMSYECGAVLGPP